METLHKKVFRLGDKLILRSEVVRDYPVGIWDKHIDELVMVVKLIEEDLGYWVQVLPENPSLCLIGFGDTSYIGRKIDIIIEPPFVRYIEVMKELEDTTNA
jgi:hypothetical protein